MSERVSRSVAYASAWSWVSLSVNPTAAVDPDGQVVGVGDHHQRPGAELVEGPPADM